MKKVISYSVGIIMVLVVLFLSIKTQPLDIKKAETATTVFDTEAYANEFWANQLPKCIKNAIDVTTLKQMLADDVQTTLDEKAHKLGISKTYYCFVKGDGKVIAVDNENVSVLVNDTTKINIATLFVFGNAIRDGSGLIDINGFINMTDYNKLPVILNKKAKQEVVKPMLKRVKVGMNIHFVGATEINSEKVEIDPLSIIPVEIKLTNGE